MAMLENLKRLFSYDSWANREVLSALQTLNAPPPRSVKWLSHIVSAEKLWHERLQLQKQTYPVWPDWTLAQCKIEIDEMGDLWNSYLESMKEDGLMRTFSYKNTKGDSFSSPRQDVLLHVVLHAAYHRGQIAADMRAAGHVPPYTDFIHAARQGFLEEE